MLVLNGDLVPEVRVGFPEVRVDIMAIRQTVALPSYATDGAAGLDVRAWLPEGEAPLVLHPGESHTMPLGFATAFPPGFGFLLIPRSGVGSRLLEVRNTVGLIDSDYRGEWIAKLRHKGEPGVDEPVVIVHRERILQAVLVTVPRVRLRFVPALPESGREGGFGSTGA